LARTVEPYPGGSVAKQLASAVKVTVAVWFGPRDRLRSFSRFELTESWVTVAVALSESDIEGAGELRTTNAEFTVRFAEPRVCGEVVLVIVNVNDASVPAPTEDVRVAV
jgi:hypothetical protein